MISDSDFFNLSSRVATLERLAGISPTPPLTYSKRVTAFKAIHFDATVDAAKRLAWDVAGRPREGYNAAHAADADFVVKSPNNETFGVAVNPVEFVALVPGVDLADHCSKGARIKLAAGEYVISRAIQLDDVIIVGSSKNETIVKWTGQDLEDYGNGKSGPRSIIQTKDSAIWRCRFDSQRRYDKTQFKVEKEQRPTLFQIQNDSTFVDVHSTDFAFAFMGNWAPARVYIRNCSADGIRKYFIWYEGSDWVVYDCSCLNSIFEHITRGSKWQRVAFNQNDFTNQDNRASDPNDDAKGTLVMQAGRHGYAWANVLNGPAGIGPLAVGDSGNAAESTQYVVHAANRITRPVQLWPGLSDALLVDEEHEVMKPRGADPRVVQRVALAASNASGQVNVVN